MTMLALLKEIAALLEKSGSDDPAKEAEVLLLEALRITSSVLYTGGRHPSEEERAYLRGIAERRVAGEPLQYIIGHMEFLGLKINVGPGVLIPRPETELLVEEVIKRFNTECNSQHSAPVFLDLCTGSGCIALSLARRFPKSEVYGTDRSEAAMVYAVQNAGENGITNVRFKLGDLFDPVKGLSFDCIVSNPPYIRRDEISTLQREVKDHEPLEALDGGKDGLDFYRKIVKEAPRRLKKAGMLALELGYDQADEVEKMAGDAGFENIRIVKDFAGIKRIFLAGVK